MLQNHDLHVRSCVHDMDLGVPSKDHIHSFSHEYVKVEKAAVGSAVACPLHSTESLETASSVVEASVDLEAPTARARKTGDALLSAGLIVLKGICGLKYCVYSRVAKVASRTCQHTCWMSDMYSSV